ncbi:MAG TPA: hypothetical protein VFC47_06955, partial [Caulobacteraceae bacterium]|nr:hypothetical protein [Caulobacteraceae bacterium]
YLGKNERTVKRWETERGLPVHRLPGDSRSRIHAHPAELDDWLKGASAEASEPAVAVPPARHRPWAVGLAAAAAAGFLGAAVLGPSGLLPHTPRAPPSVAAQRLYMEGTEAWTQRTPASLNDALTRFSAAIQRDPQYAEAWAGEAKTYLLLREYTAMPESEAYGLAESAARRALALDDDLAEAHGALGFVAANWLWSPPLAEREYRRAVALDPANPTLHHWFATFLLDRARCREALAEMDRALALSPGSSTIRADRALILEYLGQSGAATGELKRLEVAEPDFRSPHEYLSRIYFQTGPNQAFFEESERAARLAGDQARLAVIEAGRRAFATGGRRAALVAMRDVQVRQMQYGYGSAFGVARIDAMLGDDGEACRYLRISRRRHEPPFLTALASPEFVRLRAGPGACDAIAAMPSG